MRNLFLAFTITWACTAAPTPSHLNVEGVRPARVKRGAAAEAVVELKVQQGFHVHANPASRPQLIATKVEVVGGKDLEASPAVYPPPKPYKVPGMDALVDTYDGRFEVRIPIRAAQNGAAGKQEMQGSVRYQACDDKVCFPPKVVKFGVPVEIVP